MQSLITVHVDPKNYQLTLIQALNDLNLYWTSDDYRNYIVDAVQSIKGYEHYKRAVESAPYFDIRGIAALMYLKDHNEFLSDEHLNSIPSRLETVYQRFLAKASETVSVQETPKKEYKNTESLGELDILIDAALDDSSISDQDIQTIVVKSDQTGIRKELKQTLDKYQTEFEGVLNRTLDPDVLEGYNLSKRQLKRVLALIDDFNKCLGKVKGLGKTRTKKKVLTPAQLTKRIKVMRNFEEYNIQGKRPEDMIGSSIVYVYNVDKRRIYKIQCLKNIPLSAHGMQLTNIDPEKCLYKTVRKPEKFFTDLKKDLSKTGVKNAFNSLSGGASFSTAPRINNSFIILAV